MGSTLSFTIDKKEYVSNEFDFEAFCLINDNHGNEGENYIRWAEKAVTYMFRGTDDEVMALLPLSERVRLSMEAWEMYASVLKNVKPRPHTV